MSVWDNEVDAGLRDAIPVLADGRVVRGVPGALNIRSDSLPHTIVDTIADSVVIVTRDGIIRYVNPATESMFSRTAAELIGSEFGYALQDTEIELPAGERGRPRIAEMRVASTEWEGQPASLATIRDVTERGDRERLHRIEKNLLVADKRAAIAQLAAGIAHEINNPTAFILANLTVMKDILQDFENVFAEARISRKLMDKYQLTQALDDMRDMLADNLLGLDRIRSFVRELKSSTRDSMDRVEMVDLNEVVLLSCELLLQRAAPGIVVVRDLGEVPRIAADRGKLMHLMMNLFDNAARAIAVAMDQGGAGKGTIEVTTWCDDNHVIVRVSDTGCGIPAQHIDRIFDVFSMTGAGEPDAGEHGAGEHDAGEHGMGLGLPIAQNIAQSHGGRIEVVASEPGQGSEFRVILPKDTGLALSNEPVPDTRSR